MARRRLSWALGGCFLLSALACEGSIAEPDGDVSSSSPALADSRAWIVEGNQAVKAGRVREALDAYERAEAILSSLGGSTAKYKVEADLGFGFSSVYQRLGRLAEARRAAQRVRALDARRGATPADRAATWLVLARIERLDGHLEASLAAIDRGFELLDRSDNPMTRASLHQERAQHLLLDGHLEAARRELEVAADLVSGKHEGHVVSDLADVALRRGDADRAIRLARRALDLGREAADVERDAHLEAQARFVLSRALDRSGESETARAVVQEALDRVDMVRLRDASDLGLLYTDMRRDYVRHRLDLAGDAVDAFGVIEHHRATGLLVRSSPSDADRDSAEALLDALDHRRAWRSSTGSGRRIFLDAILLERRRQLWADAADAAEVPIVDRQTAASLLDGDTLALIFGEGIDSAHVLALDRGGQLDHRVLTVDRGTLGRRIVDLATSLAADRDVDAVQDDLGRLLLGPLADRLEAFGRLLIVPDGVFAELPFSALGHPRTGEPLLRSHAISVVPSLSSLAAVRRRRSGCSPAKVGAAVFGDPVLSSRDPRWPDGVADRRSGEEAALWDRLPASGSEAKSITGLYAGRGPALSALGPMATSARFLDALEEHALVHVASHAEVDPTFPESSRILFSCVDEEDQPVERCDAYLAAISERLLCGPTVILSACETAAGRRVDGEGVLGLPRALLRAGAARVVASRWPVPDSETGELMVDFHRELLAGRPAAEALRQAALKAIDRGRGSSIWAAFSVYGDDDPNLFPASVSLDVKADDARRSIPSPSERRRP